MNSKNKLNNKNRFNLTISRNSILNLEEKKSLKSFTEYYREKDNNPFNYWVQNNNDNNYFNFA